MPAGCTVNSDERHTILIEITLTEVSPCTKIDLLSAVCVVEQRPVASKGLYAVRSDGGGGRRPALLPTGRFMTAEHCETFARLSLILEWELHIKCDVIISGALPRCAVPCQSTRAAYIRASYLIW